MNYSSAGPAHVGMLTITEFAVEFITVSQRHCVELLICVNESKSQLRSAISMTNSDIIFLLLYLTPDPEKRLYLS